MQLAFLLKIHRKRAWRLTTGHHAFYSTRVKKKNGDSVEVVEDLECVRVPKKLHK